VEVSTLFLHLKYSLKYSLKIKTLRYFNYLGLFILFFSTNFFSLKFNSLKIVFYLTNNDIRLLFRESALFLSIMFRFCFSFNKESLLLTNSKVFSLLRSPFVYSKSKEHLGLKKYTLSFKVDILKDFFFYLFFSNYQHYFIQYNLVRLKRLLF
jgi:hypothetical protein